MIDKNLWLLKKSSVQGLNHSKLGLGYSGTVHIYALKNGADCACAVNPKMHNNLGQKG